MPRTSFRGSAQALRHLTRNLSHATSAQSRRTSMITEHCPTHGWKEFRGHE
jgi:hypothetical protein